MLNLEKLKKQEQITLTGTLTLRDVCGAPYAMPARNGQPANAGISFRFNGGKFSGRLPMDVAEQLQQAVERNESIPFSQVICECTPGKDGLWKLGAILVLRQGKDTVYENTLAIEARNQGGTPEKAA